MAEKPILFSAPMVRAILDGRKTQTRRVVKRAPGIPENYIHQPKTMKSEGFTWWQNPDFDNVGASQTCPYGKVGDRLWVRETWNVFQLSKDLEASFALNKIPEDDPRLNDDYCRHVVVDFPVKGLEGTDGGKGPWRPSIHMPRWASRIELEITAIRVERLQDISENDSKSEGGTYVDGGESPGGWNHTGEDTTPYILAKDSFKHLWKSINGKESWDENPWVWVVEFKRVKP